MPAPNPYPGGHPCPVVFKTLAVVVIYAEHIPILGPIISAPTISTHPNASIYTVKFEAIVDKVSFIIVAGTVGFIC